MNQDQFIHSDIQSEQAQSYSALDWVGMTQIQTSIQFIDSQKNELYVPAFLDLGVNLIENHRGIHMSRLYQLHQIHILNQPLSKKKLNQFGQECLNSQKGLSENFSARIKFNLPKVTQSLVSSLKGFRQYPAQIIFEKNNLTEKIWLQFEVLYSSTCPQSASLSLEVLKTHKEDIERLPATPHAQRSLAQVTVELRELNQEVIEHLIELVECSLGTPVQTTVKKADEMKFAQLNAAHLMFCEDAARKISVGLKSDSNLLGWKIYCEHQESLHPHNASSLILNQFKGPSIHLFS